MQGFQFLPAVEPSRPYVCFSEVESGSRVQVLRQWVNGTDLEPFLEIVAAGLCGKVAAVGIAVLRSKGLFGDFHLGVVRDREEVLC